MTKRRSAGFVVVSLLGLLAVVPTRAEAGRRSEAVRTSYEEQLQFGVEMAKRGLWKEALFRFQQADRLSPDNGHVLNNMAVAYEAAGRYEDALATYQRAIRLDSANAELKRNYARFAEFYQSFKPPVEPVAPPAEEPPTPSPEGTP
jgi:Tfp pilus assembly protein PilF